MDTVDGRWQVAAARECVALVRREYEVTLDWSLDSLAALDEVCAALRERGPLTPERLDLWTRLAGAYTGEVTVRAHGGGWTVHGSTPAVAVSGVTGFPFATAYRVLSGEPYKSLASFARALPVIAQRSRREP
jgi:hypothetical protein